MVKATQKLSDFLGTPVAAIDVFTASCILELVNFSKDLLSKSQPQLSSNLPNIPEAESDSTEFIVEVSKSRQFGICVLQLLALIYVSIMLVPPAYLSITTYLNFILSASKWIDGFPWLNYLIFMTFVPLVGFFALLLLAFAFHYLEALSWCQTMPLPLKSPSTQWILLSGGHYIRPKKFLLKFWLYTSEEQCF